MSIDILLAGSNYRSLKDIKKRIKYIYVWFNFFFMFIYFSIIQDNNLIFLQQGKTLKKIGLK